MPPEQASLNYKRHIVPATTDYPYITVKSNVRGLSVQIRIDPVEWNGWNEKQLLGLFASLGRSVANIMQFKKPEGS